MKIKNLKIGTQLIIGLSALLLFVITLGVISYFQTNKIHYQTDLLYTHPMQVRQAIGEIHTDIYFLHWALETAFNQDDWNAMQPFISYIYECENRMQKNFAVLNEYYLGPKDDILQLELITSGCKANRNQVFSLIKAGELASVSEINIHEGSIIGGDHLNEIMQKVQKIVDYSENKAAELHQESHELNNKLKIQLLIIVLIFMALSLLINYYLLHNIRSPLITLTRVTKDFKNGNMAARSHHNSANELGALSDAFNELAASVQNSFEFNRNAGYLSDLMLGEDDAHKFFQTTLKSVAQLTNSHMIAVYLLSRDKSQFELFYSIGLNPGARQAFDVDTLEGEFGKAIATKEIQHITSIDRNSRFIFHAVSGDLTPAAVLTVPIVASGDVVSIISMASLTSYNEQSLEFVKKMHNTLNARIAGILTFKRMIEFSKKLEEQNVELESQKTELFQQANELGIQNAELEMQKRQLDEANRLKTNFLSNMSHELRTPLNSVIALSGVLNRRLSKLIPEDELNYISVIERNGKLLLSLINDILDISRIEAGREEIELSTFNVCAQINEIVHTIQPQAIEKEITLTTAGGDCDVMINSDSKMFRHILQNLIGNAVKFTEAGGVVISVKQLANAIEVAVADTGIGIDSAHLPHIFDEFRQADGSTSRKFGGTGLGLAIAKKYATMLGGSIDVSSTPGEGSIFTFTLPQNQNENLATGHEQTSAVSRFSRIDYPNLPETQSLNKTILLVEDSEPAVVQMIDILKETGFKTIVATNGKEALEITEKMMPDAIILDLMMPVVDGFEVLKKLRASERTKRLPVLILTAKHISKDDYEVLRFNNIFQLIQKGDVNRHELLLAVQGMVNQIDNKKAELHKEKSGKLIEKPKILVVEDNPDNMLTVKALLANDYEVIEAVDGKESVAMAANHIPDLVLMDIALPEMDGIEAFKVIRNNINLHHIPIIALTASAMKSDREIILAYGFDAYIPKPIDEDEFFKTIKSTLYGH